MPMVRAMRLLNAIEAGTTSGGQLEILLASNAGRLGELRCLLEQRGQTRRMAASPTTMAAVAASSTAMAAVAASSTAMDAVAASSTAMAAVAASPTTMAAVAASSTAMAAVAASSTAMAAVAASSTAKMAVYNSDMALNAIAASALAMAALRAAAQYSVVAGLENGTSPVALALAGAAYILLGYSHNSTIVRTATISTLRAGTGIAAAAGPSSGISNANAADVNRAIPIKAPYAFQIDSASSYTGYFGVLRCDA